MFGDWGQIFGATQTARKDEKHSGVQIKNRNRSLVHTVFRRGARSVTVGDPSGNLLVPLVFGPAVEEGNDDHGHVVAADTARLRVGRQAVVHHVLADLFQFLLRRDTPPDKLDNGL